MIEGPYLLLAVLGVLATGVMAGVFCAFSVLVVRGLAALPPAQGVAAMNAINSSAVTPAFVIVFAGTAMLCTVIAVVTFVVWPAGAAVRLLLGSALYLVGAFGVTVAANIPRNAALLRLEAGGAERDAYWPSYVREWSRWNHVRALASVAAAGAYLLALL
ncbi:DUF1772 domain-containing protein [Streptomyces sp. MS06]|uniref:anthrone oxygenase family protein n=1 Tax=Streptomyces sp. MS06 TaxID=3385974 RepID=UPI00399FF976